MTGRAAGHRDLVGVVVSARASRAGRKAAATDAGQTAPTGEYKVVIIATGGGQQQLSSAVQRASEQTQSDVHVSTDRVTAVSSQLAPSSPPDDRLTTHPPFSQSEQLIVSLSIDRLVSRRLILAFVAFDVNPLMHKVAKMVTWNNGVRRHGFWPTVLSVEPMVQYVVCPS